MEELNTTRHSVLKVGTGTDVKNGRALQGIMYLADNYSRLNRLQDRMPMVCIVLGAGGRYWSSSATPETRAKIFHSITSKEHYSMQLLKRCSMPLLYWHEVIKGRA